MFVHCLNHQTTLSPSTSLSYISNFAQCSTSAACSSVHFKRCKATIIKMVKLCILQHTSLYLHGMTMAFKKYAGKEIKFSKGIKVYYWTDALLASRIGFMIVVIDVADEKNAHEVFNNLFYYLQGHALHCRGFYSFNYTLLNISL